MIEALKIAIANDEYLTTRVDSLVIRLGSDAIALEDALREFLQDLHDSMVENIESTPINEVFVAITQSAVNEMMSASSMEELARWAIARYKDKYPETGG